MIDNNGDEIDVADISMEYNLWVYVKRDIEEPDIHPSFVDYMEYLKGQMILVKPFDTIDLVAHDDIWFQLPNVMRGVKLHPSWVAIAGFRDGKYTNEYGDRIPIPDNATHYGYIPNKSRIRDIDVSLREPHWIQSMDYLCETIVPVVDRGYDSVEVPVYSVHRDMVSILGKI